MASHTRNRARAKKLDHGRPLGVRCGLPEGPRDEHGPRSGWVAMDGVFNLWAEAQLRRSSGSWRRGRKPQGWVGRNDELEQLE